MLAPICLFTYNRLNETMQTVKALQENYLSSESDLIIFSDGGKDEASWQKVNAVRAYIQEISGFKNIKIFESPINKGLANSIISGVSKVIEQYGKVIVLEDDLITSKNFLDFMNQCLDFYQDSSKVLSISGFSFSNIHSPKYKYDITFGYRASSWGWGTWKNRWEKIDWDLKSYTFNSNFLSNILFLRGGSDTLQLLEKQQKGLINSWAIRFCYHQHINELYDVYPKNSKVLNIGFSENATNCHSEKYRFKTRLDKSENRHFKLIPFERVRLLHALKFYWHYSIIMRILAKIIGFKNKKLK